MNNKSIHLSLLGSYAGAVLGIPLSGILTEYLNWQVAFYFYGNFQRKSNENKKQTNTKYLL